MKNMPISGFRCLLPIIFVVVGLILFSCEDKKKNGPVQVYNGPLMVTDNLAIMMSDSGKTTVKVTTARQIKLQTEDEVYPKAVYVTFYDKNGVEYSSLRGDSGRYFKSEGLYRVMGNVFFFNRLQQQSLSTDLLNWSTTKRKIFTDHPFIIKTRFDEIHGIGMEGDQDFTHFTMRRATGVLAIDSVAAGGAEAEQDTTSN
ncbi:LPS export ABC transporter periplasmic protein LptC [Emticicia sp. 21SJ11W-3]|uniref:LPS export ABC transporter periplasmic protein LptC n=1 Tax=Emticicia sp. 21SJ11W-3 TaxID=2916755 RepID=UPI0020A0B471|nr:LPS export ABC transporter periplasmic protein LptC [Emticicia sp. 21SJ11W-3]UTA68923.1 LPS export ABC transporter periplasmic protein LptC [Emticicia sp. 21SJ11W-3]